jgi:antitoxin component YwqK of YwqJK toxin-antitoxin module
MYLVLCLAGTNGRADDVAAGAASSQESLVMTIAEPAELSDEPAPLPEQEMPEDGSADIIRERYPSGKVKVERHVTQDAEGNYVNHGSWKMWDENGTLLADGQYRHNRRHGVWNRWYKGDESKLFSEQPYNQFAGPFVSQAAFEEGQMHGEWLIYDSKQRKISQVQFADGQRSGKAVWYFPNGKPMRDTTFRGGVIDGELRQWNADGKLAVQETYQSGRKLAPKIEYYRNTQKKSEGNYLHAPVVVQTADDWWNAQLATFTTQGKDERHGTLTIWYENGQKQRQGDYQYDLPIGKYVWWYSNGQKALEGTYKNGKQQGIWTWWHNNGQKATEGMYTDGYPVQNWMWWKPDGKVAQKADLSHHSGEVISEKRNPREAALPQPELLQPITR